MEFVKFHYTIQLANQLASWFASCLFAGLRPASELESIGLMEFGLYRYQFRGNAYLLSVYTLHLKYVVESEK